MFLLNSRHPLLFTFLRAFLPRLQADFAEFLRLYCPLRLNLLNLCTCVGFGTAGYGFTPAPVFTLWDYFRLSQSHEATPQPAGGTCFAVTKY